MGRQKFVYRFHRFHFFSSSPSSAYPIISQNSIVSSAPNSLLYPRFSRKVHTSLSEFTFLTLPNVSSVRSFSWSSSAENEASSRDDMDEDLGGSLEPSNLGFDSLNVGEEGGAQLNWYSPLRGLISLLDEYHDITGFPWWVIIGTSTLGLRMAIFPIIILQLKKLKKVSEWMPKLPPPFPPPFSGRSFKDQYLLFRKKRQAVGCPSPLWMCASFAIQIPSFILWMASIRHMSLNHHPGFDTGGTLWFQNLTDFPHGVLGLIFPSLIAGLHFTNIQVSFQTSSIRSYPGVFGLLAKYYKLYLEVLTIPIFLVGFVVPQGSLVYWLTNSSLNLLQQYLLRDPYIQQQLGIPAVNVSRKPEVSEPDQFQRLQFQLPPFKHPRIFQKLGIESSSISPNEYVHTDNLPPSELFSMGIQYLEAAKYEKALPLLRLASEKDPELEVTASLAMGLFLLSKKSYIEASEHFEHVVSKIDNSEAPHVIIASYGAGVSLIFQGRNREGIEHLRRIAQMKEPDCPVDKSCYFQGLILLGSILHNERQKNEALIYLRRAADFDPSINNLVKICESAEDQ